MDGGTRGEVGSPKALYKEHCVLEGGCSSSGHGIREGGRMEWGFPGLVEPRRWGFGGGFRPMRVGYPCPVGGLQVSSSVQVLTR